ncbi:right-handed parallel beta-helix repeat-containing protein [Fibrella sp. HMF5335]|uniref:Right-handed parallel beta-helix repeat-containing protein n=1 Tax=Fibrella rubiginis TaxID=2817060 RepID=A0A939GL62_9BACT|nr:right-handed parallel beta-helix repeat-containing protein [Fibrella rubiginis]MBO0938835.1 right-handed parallel beta-helix repeat-containing protein [Fibrella rubiginis]
MKINHLMHLILLLTMPLLLSYCKPAEVDPDTLIRTTATDTLTIAGVRGMTKLDVPGTIQITDAGRQGTFRLMPSDKTSADNMGTVLVTANGRRYVRQYMGAANAFWFGITPADDDIGPELQAAVDAAVELVIPDGVYTQRTTVRLPGNRILRANPGKVTIKLPATYVSLASPVSSSLAFDNVTLDGLGWAVSSQEKGTYGVITIDGPSVNNLTIQNCTSTDAAAKDSTNFLTLKIQTGKKANNVVIQNNTIGAKRMAFEIFNHDNFNVYAGTNIRVAGNVIHDCRFGISLSGPLDGNTVVDNELRNCSLYGIEIAGALRNVVITNNRFAGKFDKLIIGSNDGQGNGTLQGGMEVSGNRTLGTCVGGVQLFNAGTANVNRNSLSLTGRLEIISPSSNGGTYSQNVIETTGDNAVICDNAPNNKFVNNTFSNRTNGANIATFRAYGAGAQNVTLSGNRIIKGTGGVAFDAVNGAVLTATDNINEVGTLIP